MFCNSDDSTTMWQQNYLMRSSAPSENSKLNSHLLVVCWMWLLQCLTLPYLMLMPKLLIG